VQGNSRYRLRPHTHPRSLAHARSRHHGISRLGRIPGLSLVKLVYLYLFLDFHGYYPMNRGGGRRKAALDSFPKTIFSLYIFSVNLGACLDRRRWLSFHPRKYSINMPS
jgi:hypothetical protein